VIAIRNRARPTHDVFSLGSTPLGATLLVELCVVSAGKRAVMLEHDRHIVPTENEGSVWGDRLEPVTPICRLPNNSRVSARRLVLKRCATRPWARSGLEPLLARRGDRSVAHGLLASKLSCSAQRFALFACRPFGRLLIEPPPLHFPEHAFALQFFLQDPKRLVDIVVANEHLQKLLLAPGSETGRVLHASEVGRRP
jgi:hypothetical protein